MANLIPAPDLDIRDEEQLAAEMIGRVSGGIDAVRINSQIEERRRLLDMIADESLPASPVCPELTNANPSSPHTVLLELFGWGLAHIARRINQLPERDQIAFANLFGIGLREATKATTTLRFTSDGQNNATIPEGTEVSTEDGAIAFVTTEELEIPADPDATTGDVAAECTVAGPVLLTGGTLTKLSDPIAFVLEVANPDPVDSGAAAETVDQALARARSFQRRGLRLVSAQDVEDFVFYEVMQGVGIVKVFPFIQEGDFTVRHAGHTTIVAMTPNGHGISDETVAAIGAGLEQMIGSQFVSVMTPHDIPNEDDPLFIPFDVAASIKIESIAPQDAIEAAVESNLRSFYATNKGNFGRSILRSEIIAVIEGAPGVDRIVSDPDGPIVQTPGADLAVAPYQLPKLEAVTLTVVP